MNHSVLHSTDVTQFSLLYSTWRLVHNFHLGPAYGKRATVFARKGLVDKALQDLKQAESLNSLVGVIVL